MAEPTKRENGYDFPASAYAYVPDPEKPSTWKLRLWETPDKKETPRQVGMAVAALGEGFRGNKVEIPAEDLPKVKAKVRAAWKKVHPDASDDEMPDVLKKRRLLDVLKAWFAGEAIELEDDGDDDQTQAHDLQTALQSDQYSDQLLATLVAALADTIDSIIDDPNVQDKKQQVVAALQDFANRLEAVGVVKVGRKISGARMQTLKQIQDLLNRLIQEVEQADNTDDNTNTEGAGDVNKIDKSMLPPEVREYVEALEKRAAQAEANAAGEIAEVRKRMEELEKRAREAEEIAKREREERVTKQFIEKAAAYKGLPVQPEEFGKVLKSLAEKAPDEFAKLDEVLRAADEAIAKGKLFAELGGNGRSEGSAYAKLEGIAKAKVAESGGQLTFAQAFQKACQEHPELYLQYKEEKGV
jgi:hypothetical protein